MGHWHLSNLTSRFPLPLNLPVCDGGMQASATPRPKQGRSSPRSRHRLHLHSNPNDNEAFWVSSRDEGGLDGYYCDLEAFWSH